MTNLKTNLKKKMKTKLRTEVDDKGEEKIDRTFEDKVKDALIQYQKPNKKQMGVLGDDKLT